MRPAPFANHSHTNPARFPSPKKFRGHPQRKSHRIIAPRERLAPGAAWVPGPGCHHVNLISGHATGAPPILLTLGLHMPESASFWCGFAEAKSFGSSPARAAGGSPSLPAPAANKPQGGRRMAVKSPEDWAS